MDNNSTTPAPMTSKAFAEGLQSASYFEVQKIVDAIDAGRAGSRKAVTGNDLMAAANYILTGKKPDPAPPEVADTPKPKK